MLKPNFINENTINWKEQMSRVCLQVIVGQMMPACLPSKCILKIRVESEIFPSTHQIMGSRIIFFAHFPGSDPNLISNICFLKGKASFLGLAMFCCEPEGQEGARTPGGRSTGLRIRVSMLDHAVVQAQPSQGSKLVRGRMNGRALGRGDLL